MAQDVTKIVETLHARKVVLGLSFEQLILILYPLFLIPTAYFWLRDIRRRRFSPPVPAGCTKLGLKGKSHNDDEFDKKYDEGTTDTSQWKVKAIYIHPIKSCAPVELDVADVDAEGIDYDRKFAFAELLKPAVTKTDATEEDKKPKWTFRTLRQPGYEKLALVKTEVWVPKQSNGVDQAKLRRVEREGALIVRWPNEPTGAFAPLDRLMLRWGLIPKERFFQVPLDPSKGHDYPSEKVNIWLDDPTWLNMGRHVPEDFKQWLEPKNPLSLFRADPEQYRQVFRCAPRKEQVGFQPAVGFQDAYPLNLLNISSVHDIGKKVGKAIDGLSVRRFRGNLILEGPPAYDEDDWKRLSIGGNEIYCACRTIRCRLPNVDPDTSERHSAEPDKTLKSFRCIDDGDPKNAALGLQLVPATNNRFQIRVGDTVKVLERGTHHYIKQGH